MINLSLPVATPTPLLDYTIRHRHTVEVRKDAVVRYYDKVDSQLFDQSLTSPT